MINRARIPSNRGTTALTIGGWLSVLAALLHVGCIIGGPDWYRFFGAGEEMALADQRCDWFPAVITGFIAAILGIWALFAFSGAGKFARLPLLRTGLVIISAIYMVRALAFFPAHLIRPDLTDSFALWSSLIVLAYGLAYTIGTWRAWPALSGRA
jgi:hypothetical protein